MRFHTKIELGGRTATGIPVPEEIVDGLGSRRRQPVRVTIKDFTYRSTVAPYGGAFMIPLSAENRSSAGVAAGDEVDVEVELDPEPREVTVPADLAEALAADPAAQTFFEDLSYSYKRGFVLSLQGARTEETRRRRIKNALDALREGRTR